MECSFKREELDRAIESSRDKSSPGLDKVEYKMIKGLSDKSRDELLCRINYAFEKGKIYNDWKLAKTIFIDKKDKNKVRPITMSSCLGKIMERMINGRLV